MFKYLYIWIVTLALIVNGEICRKDICKYDFEIHSSRTMGWKGPDGKIYDVKMNGTRLQIVGNLNNLQPNDNIGKLVNEDEVITADGYKRTVITVNGQFPGPSIEVQEGSQIVVRVVNKLYREVLTIHWHGMNQRGTPWMDGTPNLSQCPILPDQSFTYRFIADPVGTHWYHSHVMGQRIDGLFGLLVIHPKTNSRQIAEFPLLVGDWWHIDGKLMEVINPSSADPLDKGSGEDVYIHPSFRDYSHDYVNAAALVWQSALINGRGRHGTEKYPLSRFDVKHGQAYRFRMANVGAEFGLKVSIDDHLLTVVALDGSEIQPVDTDFIYIDPGESIDFEVRFNQIEGLYWLRAESPHDYEAFETMDGGRHDVKAVIVYGGIDIGEPRSKSLTCTPTKKCMHFNCPFGTFPPSYSSSCINIDDVTSQLPEKEIAEMFGVGETEDIHEVFINIGYHVGSALNSRKMVMPTAPVFQKDAHIVDCDKECKGKTNGCRCTYMIDLPFNKTIQVVFSNYEPVSYVGHHPMHLHGHNFAVMHTGFANHDSVSGRWVSHNSDVACEDDSTYCMEPSWNRTRPVFSKTRPAIKDTVHVPARGYAVIRFKSVNPGFWFFHCHMNHHVENGMAAVFKEADGYIHPPPEGMPTCPDLTYTDVQFRKNMDRYREFLHGSGTGDYLIEKMDINAAMGQTTTKSPAVNGNPGECAPEEGHMMIKTADFIGALIGCVVLGFVISLIPLYIYIKYGKRSSTAPAVESKLQRF